MSTPTPIVWRIEVSPTGALPTRERPVQSNIYLIEADWSRSAAERAARELLADPICETFQLAGSTEPAGPAPQTSTPGYEVHLLPGVMDPVAASTEMALADMKLPAASVRTARGYRYAEKPTAEALTRLFNPAVERLVVGSLGCAASPHPPAYAFTLRTVVLSKMSDRELAKLSKDMHLFLDLREMQAVQAHFRDLGREPTDVELETIAQTWSEHCVHKTLKASVDCQMPGSEGSPKGRGKNKSPLVHFDNLIKETIFSVTQKLNRPWCLSVFKDNAGVIAFDEKWAVCFKVETHNRPSAIEPYGGAATGIGGVIRDVLGTGLGAKPIANTDVFCFAPAPVPTKLAPADSSGSSTQNSALPPGVLPPARVMNGVVAGVRDYGNRMGIPTVNGALYFEPRYLANPLVFCGCVGLIPRDKIAKEVHPGDRIVVVGGRTGRDGIHGATFSSGEIQHDTAATFGSAVQIGNAITEKKTMDVLLQARDAGPGGSSLYTAVTDCGAGGLSSAVGEMGSELGAEVHLERVPLKYAGLRYDEIWISEAQERMVLSVPPENVARVIQLFAAEDVEATDLGQFGCQDDQKRPVIKLHYQGRLVGQLDCRFLHDGTPKRHIQAVFEPQSTKKKKAAPPKKHPPETAAVSSAPIQARLLTELSDPNVASKASVWRMYDHEVQGGTLIKPYAAQAGHLSVSGPTDAAVLRPLATSNKGVVLSNGLCPQLSDFDPYWMAFAAIDEAIRNAVCVGADPQRLAILDNFCWGNCTKPDRMGELVRACQACHDAALLYGTPFISGKDSLNNEYNAPDGTNITIPGTLLISAMGVIEDVHQCLTPTLRPGDPLYLVGQPTSWPWEATGDSSNPAPLPVFNPELAAKTHRAMAELIRLGMIRAAHDVSDGGLLVTVAEMLFSSKCSAVFAGQTVFTGQAPRDRLPRTFTPPTAPLSVEAACFTPWPGCYVVQTSDPVGFAEKAGRLGLPFVGIGMAAATDREPMLLVRAGLSEGEVVAQWPVAALRSAWEGKV